MVAARWHLREMYLLTMSARVQGQRKTSFLGLPLELRQQIYDHYLLDANTETPSEFGTRVLDLFMSKPSLAGYHRPIVATTTLPPAGTSGWWVGAWFPWKGYLLPEFPLLKTEVALEARLHYIRYRLAMETSGNSINEFIAWVQRLSPIEQAGVTRIRIVSKFGGWASVTSAILMLAIEDDGRRLAVRGVWKAAKRHEAIWTRAIGNIGRRKRNGRPSERFDVSDLIGVFQALELKSNLRDNVEFDRPSLIPTELARVRANSEFKHLIYAYEL